MESYKFRAKVNNPKSNMDGQWYYFTLQEAFKADPIMCRNLDWSTLGMWTTLHDKNGKEIYEEDWWKHPDYGINRIVFGEFKINDFEGIEERGVCFAIEWGDGSGYRILDSEFAKEGEVVGSYHETPDLLTDSKEEK